MTSEFKNLDLKLYHEKLDNGLNIYIVPKKNVNNCYVTLTTKYGSIDTKFKLNDELIESPAGIAHFLEHKMFEQKDGSDPFQIFDQNGAQSNAVTSNYKTSYYFSGPNNIKENIETLLDFVQAPYFTEENVDKEKGIIIQELKMGNDSPIRVGYNLTLKNAFINNPINIPVIGTEKSIKSITKEDLYKCYDAFYNPSNMFMAITGNVNYKEVINIIKNNQKNKKFKKNKLEKMSYKEPDKVLIKKEIKNMNVSIPKLYYSIKINTTKIPLEQRIIIKYLSLYLDSLYGSVSDFNEEIENEKIAPDGIDFIISKIDTHILITFIAETKKPSKLIKKINEYIGNEITLDSFNRKKKVVLSSNIFMSDNIYSINNKIIYDVLEMGEVITDIYEENKNLKYDVLLDMIKKISFKNTCEVIIRPNKKTN